MHTERLLTLADWLDKVPDDRLHMAYWSNEFVRSDCMTTIASNAEMPTIVYVPMRLAVEWDGSCWAEIDPASGVCVAIGEKPRTKEGSDTQPR